MSQFCLTSIIISSSSSSDISSSISFNINWKYKTAEAVSNFYIVNNTLNLSTLMNPSQFSSNNLNAVFNSSMVSLAIRMSSTSSLLPSGYSVLSSNFSLLAVAAVILTINDQLFKLSDDQCTKNISNNSVRSETFIINIRTKKTRNVVMQMHGNIIIIIIW